MFLCSFSDTYGTWISDVSEVIPSLVMALPLLKFATSTRVSIREESTGLFRGFNYQKAIF